MMTTMAHELTHLRQFKSGLDMKSPYGKGQTEAAAYQSGINYAKSKGWSCEANFWIKFIKNNQQFNLPQIDYPVYFIQ